MGPFETATLVVLFVAIGAFGGAMWVSRTVKASARPNAAAATGKWPLLSAYKWALVVTGAFNLMAWLVSFPNATSIVEWFYLGIVEAFLTVILAAPLAAVLWLVARAMGR